MTVYIGIILTIIVITFLMPWQDSKNVLIGQKKMGLTYYKLQLFIISAILVFLQVYVIMLGQIIDNMQIIFGLIVLRLLYGTKNLGYVLFLK